MMEDKEIKELRNVVLGKFINKSTEAKIEDNEQSGGLLESCLRQKEKVLIEEKVEKEKKIKEVLEHVDFTLIGKIMEKR